MGCTHSKKNSKISSEKSISVLDRSNASLATVQDTVSSDVASLENSTQRSTKEKKSAPKQKVTTTKYQSANENKEITGVQPHSEEIDRRKAENTGRRLPDTHDLSREAARAAAREAAQQAAKEAAREARKERRRKEERQRNKHHPPHVINTFWDQEDHEYIVRNNIQRNQRRLHAIQDRDEADDTLFEIPIRMPEVDFTRQATVIG